MVSFVLIGLQCYQAQNRRFKIFAKKIERDPGIVLGRLLNDGQDDLFSKLSDEELKYFDINTIAQPIRETMECIAERIKRELQDYLISGEELNRLANDSWFDKSVKFEER